MVLATNCFRTRTPNAKNVERASNTKIFRIHLFKNHSQIDIIDVERPFTWQIGILYFGREVIPSSWASLPAPKSTST